MKIINKLWACEKNFLQGYLNERARFDIHKASPEEMKSFFDKKNARGDLPSILEISGDQAFISIIGPLSKTGPDFIDMFFGFGGTAYLDIIECANILLNDKEIKTVTLKMDTPGGAVNGVDETFQAIDALCKKKEVIAENNGMIASAGYWIASAADKIVAIAPTTETGSIGVIISTYDDSAYLKQLGFKRIVIVSQNAPNKHADVSTKKGIELLRDRANAIEKVFISRVASGRKISEEKVISDFGKGGVMITKDALNAGLIDGLIGLALDTVDSQGQEGSESNIETGDTAAVADPKQNDGGHMTLEEMLAANPAMAEEVKKIKSESFADGEKAAKEKMKKSVDSAAKYLGTDYPDPITKLAVSVIKDEKSADALDAAVAAYDATKADAESAAAQEETAAQGETHSDKEGKKAQTGKLENDDDEQAAIANLKNI